MVESIQFTICQHKRCSASGCLCFASIETKENSNNSNFHSVYDIYQFILSRYCFLVIYRIRYINLFYPDIVSLWFTEYTSVRFVYIRLLEKEKICKISAGRKSKPLNSALHSFWEKQMLQNYMVTCSYDETLNVRNLPQPQLQEMWQYSQSYTVCMGYACLGNCVTGWGFCTGNIMNDQTQANDSQQI